MRAALCCTRCSVRALDRAAGRKGGYGAKLIAGDIDAPSVGVVEAYASVSGVRPAWLAFGCGAMVEALPTHDPARIGDRAALAAALRPFLAAPTTSTNTTRGAAGVARDVKRCKAARSPRFAEGVTS